MASAPSAPTTRASGSTSGNCNQPCVLRRPRRASSRQAFEITRRWTAALRCTSAAARADVHEESICATHAAYFRPSSANAWYRRLRRLWLPSFHSSSAGECVAELADNRDVTGSPHSPSVASETAFNVARARAKESQPWSPSAAPSRDAIGSSYRSIFATTGQRRSKSTALRGHKPAPGFSKACSCTSREANATTFSPALACWRYPKAEWRSSRRCGQSLRTCCQTLCAAWSPKTRSAECWPSTARRPRLTYQCRSSGVA
jgi:hypothetical protein